MLSGKYKLTNNGNELQFSCLSVALVVTLCYKIQSSPLLNMTSIQGENFCNLQAQNLSFLLDCKIINTRLEKNGVRLNCPGAHQEGTWGREVVAPLIFKLGTKWGRVVSCTPRPLYPLSRRLGEPQSRSECFGENYLASPGNRTTSPLFPSPEKVCSDYGIPSVQE